MLYVDYNVYYNVDHSIIYSQKNSNPVVASPSGSVGSGADRQDTGLHAVTCSSLRNPLNL